MVAGGNPIKSCRIIIMVILLANLVINKKTLIPSRQHLVWGDHDFYRLHTSFLKRSIIYCRGSNNCWEDAVIMNFCEFFLSFVLCFSSFLSLSLLNISINELHSLDVSLENLIVLLVLCLITCLIKLLDNASF